MWWETSDVINLQNLSCKVGLEVKGHTEIKGHNVSLPNAQQVAVLDLDHT